MLIRTLASLILVAPFTNASDLSAIVAPDATVQKRADGFGFTEGPAWHIGEQALYFSDLKNRTIHRWSAKEGITEVRRGDTTFANGIVIDKEGRLIFCETGDCRIVRREHDGTETVLVDKVDGRSLGPTNDLWLAPDESIYFTVPMDKKKKGKPASEGQLFGTIIHLRPDGTARDVGTAVNVKAPNGIVGSADGKRLYFRDGGTCRVATIEPDGTLTDAKIAAPKSTDGLTLDEHGNLYTTSQEGIEIFAPDTSRIGLIPVPESPANVTFGGPDGRTLFITARTGLYAIEMKVKGD